MTKRNNETHKEYYLQVGPFNEQEKQLIKQEMKKRNLKIRGHLKDLTMLDVQASIASLNKRVM